MIKNAKVICANADQAVYHMNCDRGNPKFTMSASGLKLFGRSPRAWIRGANDPAEGDSVDFGSVLDSLLISNDFDKRFVVQPEKYKNLEGEEKDWTLKANVCKAWVAGVKAEGKEPIKADLYSKAKYALESFKEGIIESILKNSQHQVWCSAEWHDRNGIVVPLKCLIDIVPSLESDWLKSLVDLKSSTSIAPGFWKKHCYSYGYHIQAALYLDIYREATGEDRQDFRHIAVCNEFPYEVSDPPFVFSQSYEQVGRERYTMLLHEYAEALETSLWKTQNEMYLGSGYQPIDGCVVIEPEDWMVKE